MTIDLVICAVVQLVAAVLVGRLAYPRWKLVGRPVFALGVTALLSSWVGHWSLLYAVGQPVLGISLHAAWCMTHGLDPWRVDRETLMKAQMEWVQEKLRQRAAKRGG